ncbi:MAG: Phage protein [Edwardsiella phage MSW-3]|nr:MAG: Phage protein [Edwardsiella phage MSW-3]
MTPLQRLMLDLIFEEHVNKLVAMPDWEFCVVMMEGLGDVCCGCTHKGVLFTEQEIVATYFKRWPDAEPLY